MLRNSRDTVAPHGARFITFREIEKSAGGFGAGGRVTRRDLITFCFDMEQITRAGIPLLEGIRDLRDSIENSRFRVILATLIEATGQTVEPSLSTYVYQ